VRRGGTRQPAWAVAAWVVAMGAVILLARAPGSVGAPGHPFPRFTEPNCLRADFPSEAQRVRAELCRATRDSAVGRAVVVLHGCGGFSTLDHRLAVTLADDGISTLYPD
jgi:hypothetical protein